MPGYKDHGPPQAGGYSRGRLALAAAAGVLMGLGASLAWLGSRELLHLQSHSLALRARLDTARAQEVELVGRAQKERTLAETQLEDVQSELATARLHLAVRDQERRQLLDRAAQAKEAAGEAAAKLAQAQERLEAAQRDASAARAKLASARASSAGFSAGSGAQEGGEGAGMSHPLGDQGGTGPGAVGRHTPWGPSEERDRGQPELAALLRRVAVGDEVLVAISNQNYAGQGGMLDTWIAQVQRSNIANAMVVALDDATLEHVADKGMAAIRMQLEIPESQAGVGSNHAVSGLKFRILRRFAELGYAVLLSDVDVIFLQNPFPHLHRDCDVEGMTDGWDNATAYGYNDVKDDPAMGWARYAHSMRVFSLNSGLFYLRPTAAALALLDRIAHRLATEAGWDQAIFNEVIFFPSSPGYEDPAVTRRVLDYLLFMNSKVLFTAVRHQSRYSSLQPVSIHVNYHPDKHARMLAIVDYYIHGNAEALRPFPDGSQ